ncbi:MAG TPA: hypothetical protein VF627_10400 [Abditibacterium sp.]
MPLAGIAFQLPLAQAQTTLTAPVKNPKPLSPEVKTKIDKYLALAHLEALCKTQLDLKVENSTVERVFASIQFNFPTETIPISARGVAASSFSFDLKEQNVGYLLQYVANRSDANLYLLSSGLLIAPASQLTEAERGDVARGEGGTWPKNLRAGGHSWSTKIAAQKLFYSTVAHEVTKSDANPQAPLAVKTTFDAFSPDSQAMLQQIAAWCDQIPWVLHPGSPVEVDVSKPAEVSITFRAAKNDSNRGFISTSVYFK